MFAKVIDWVIGFRVVVGGMSAARKELKRSYRRYVTRVTGQQWVGLIYMGYVVPLSLREWVSAGCP